MAHVHTGPGHHDATVSFFIVRTDLDEPHLTYHVHRKTGKLAMYGGHIELHEHPLAALRHEAVEESGYALEQLNILQPRRRLSHLTGAVVHPVPVVSSTGQFPGDVVHFHTDLLYALTASEPPKHAPAAGESTDIRLFTRDELARVPADDIVEMWREVGDYILTDIIGTWHELPLSAFED